jgi:hypothetical protein
VGRESAFINILSVPSQALCNLPRVDRKCDK